ncbi:MAG: hypothetical protein J6J12_06225 [Oscillospiraceae bacterium]|nr:hypothetical protein [Oscillospiraceae bacterium]
MGKNDFDIDFSFDDDYSFDPKAFLGEEEYNKDIDLNAYSDEELGLTPPKKEEEDSFDLDEDLDLDDFLNMADQEDADEEDPDEEEYEEEDDVQDVPAEEEEEYFQEAEDEAEYVSEEAYEEDEAIEADPMPGETDMNEEMEYEELEALESSEEYEEEAVPAEADEESGEEPVTRKPREKKPLPKITLPKLKAPKILTKFFDLYFAPVLHKELQEEPVDPNKPRRRRKSRQQIFKEFYLPPILVCISLILVLSFIIGSLSNVIALRKIEDEAKKNQLDASISAAELAEQQNDRIVAEAEALAAQYNYQEAINLLNSINGGDLTSYPEIGAKVADYTTIQSQLVEHKEPSLIPNLSFHVLIADPTRAFKDDTYGGQYNKNFVTCDEFSKILNELYNNGYVLVDFDSFAASNTDLDGNQKFYIDPILLPEGKKPVMITETMVNYFDYMTGGDGDGTPDANGDGFASRLVVNGDSIKAEYIDAQGQTQVGNYDLVPILEDFIAQHPDFSYRGARATLAFTGHEGVFGYRCNTTYIGTKGQDFYDQQVAGAQQIANALRAKGYTLACYTYSNEAYAGYSVAQISASLTSWTNEVTNIIGPVDTFVFAKTSNITDFSGQAFNVMYTSGFRYFIGHGTKPYAEVNTTYVRQNRLMVTGENMVHYASQFTDLSLFNPNVVLDLTNRGNVPKSG